MSRGSASRGQSSVELLAAFGVYLLVAGLILESAHQLELPARSALAKEKLGLEKLAMAADLALADGLEIRVPLNQPYSFNKTQVSSGKFFASVNAPFVEAISCETEAVFKGLEGVNATCVAR